MQLNITSPHALSQSSDVFIFNLSKATSRMGHDFYIIKYVNKTHQTTK